MNTDAASAYVLSRAIYRLTQRGVQEATLAICSGPLSPLTEMQSLALRVALGQIIREAVGVGRWYERQAAAGRTRAPADNPHFDDEVTTEPGRPAP